MSFNVRDQLKKNYAVTEPGEEVVISGISGRFPESRNVIELKNNLMNKVDLITDNSTRWRQGNLTWNYHRMRGWVLLLPNFPTDHAEIPKAGGKVTDLNKFDAIFFGVHYKQAHTMDPMCRLLMEHAYEAVIDAGINPKLFKGSNTGVVIGSCVSESEKTWFYEKLQVTFLFQSPSIYFSRYISFQISFQANGLGITGCSRAMLANRISYFMDLHGPSYVIDTACSSSMFALDQAYRLIRNGTCDAVIVGGSNLCLHPYVSLQFSRLGK